MRSQVRSCGRASALAAALTLWLAGCAADEPAATGATTPSPPVRSTPAPSAGPRGTADPGALRDFECAADRSGSWAATGTVVNTSAAAADFVVTVAVAAVPAGAVAAKRVLLPDLGSGRSAPLELHRLPAPAAPVEPSCQVQVLRR